MSAIMPDIYEALLGELTLPPDWAPVPWVPFAEMDSPEATP